MSNKSPRALEILGSSRTIMMSAQLVLALGWCVATSALSAAPPVRPHALPTAAVPRRAALRVAAAALGVGSVLGALQPCSALIKGSAPPEGGFSAKKNKPKERRCSNIDECEALGEKAQVQIDEASGVNLGYERTSGGDRYRDVEGGSGAREARAGDSVSIRYRVMRLGTRARDGLSGEGQTIFSLGYGEDDEAEGSVLETSVGPKMVPGVAAAIEGMKAGGRRRVLVRPERGWREQSDKCGSIVFKADIGASVEEVEGCLDKTRLPQPSSFQAQRRFARRFDESLLVEIDLVQIAP